MKRMFHTLAAGMFLTTGLLMIGCSDDKGGSPLPAGDANDPDYVAFTESVDGINNTFDGMVEGVFAQVGEIDLQGSLSVSKDRSPYAPRFASFETDSFTATYDTASDYWHTYLSYNDTLFGISAVFRDSLQFRDSTGATMQWPDSATLARIFCGQNATFTFSGDSGSVSLSAQNFWDIAGLPGAIAGKGDVMISGQASADIDLVEFATECTANLSMTREHTNIGYNLAELETGDVCPTSGQVVIEATAASQCTSQGSSVTFDGNWRWEATFTPGMVRIEANNGRFQWTYDGVCPVPES